MQGTERNEIIYIYQPGLIGQRHDGPQQKRCGAHCQLERHLHPLYRSHLPLILNQSHTVQTKNVHMITGG